MEAIPLDIEWPTTTGRSIPSPSARSWTRAATSQSVHGAPWLSPWPGRSIALAARAFELLRDGVGRLPATPAPVEDLVQAGLVFRRFAIEHPSLFRIAFGSTPDGPIRARPVVREAATIALEALKTRIARLAD